MIRRNTRTNPERFSVFRHGGFRTCPNAKSQTPESQMPKSKMPNAEIPNAKIHESMSRVKISLSFDILSRSRALPRTRSGQFADFGISRNFLVLGNSECRHSELSKPSQTPPMSLSNTLFFHSQPTIQSNQPRT